MRRMLLICLLVAGLLAALPVSAQEPTLAELLTTAAEADEPEFTTLLGALQAVDPSVLEALSDPNGQWTLFAPTDAAFASYEAALGEAAFADLMADPEDLLGMLQYHVAPGVFDYAALSNSVDALATLPYMATSSMRITLPTLEGQHLDVLPGYESLRIDNAALAPALADQLAGNGVLHTIGAVLQPETYTISRIITTVAGGANPQFTVLAAALEAAGLAERLNDGAAEAVTLFAPTDQAFDAAFTNLGVTQEEALADSELMASLLEFHLVPGLVYAADLGSAATADPAPAWLASANDDGTLTINTVSGAPLTFGRGAQGEPVVDLATLLLNDVDATNGVIHVISAVLLPPGVGE